MVRFLGLQNSRLALLVASFLAVGTLVSCGGSHDPNQRGVHVGESGPLDPSKVDFDDGLNQLRSIFLLYAGRNGFTREQISNVIDKVREKYGHLITDDKLTPEQFINLLFEFDKNKNAHLTWEELLDGLKERSPVLKWLLENPSPTIANLKKLMRMQFPNASEVALDGAAQAMFLFDHDLIGGNNNGKLEGSEISIAGVIMTFLEKSQCFKGDVCIQVPMPDPTTLMPILKQKLNKQLYTRYPEPNFEKLSQEDFALETIQMGARFFAVDRLVNQIGGAGIESEMDAARLMALGGISLPENWVTMRSFFDCKLLNGNNDEALSAVEAFHMLTETMFAAKVRIMFEGDFSYKSAKAHFSAVLDLKQMFPYVGHDLFFAVERVGTAIKPYHLRGEFWDEFMDFDKPSMEGNGNEKLELGEVALQLAYVDVLNFIYIKYDSDKDVRVSRSEAKKIFKDLGADDAEGAVKVFFAGKLLSEDFKKTPWAVIKIGLHSVFGPRELMPDSFYRRMKIQLKLFL